MFIQISLSRGLRPLLVVLCLLLLLCFFGGGWLDQKIFSPPRLQLHDYHLQRLNNPAEFGLRIQHHRCVDGKVACLLVEPAGLPGERGVVLRQQLQERGIQPVLYGEVRGTLVMLHGRNARKESLLGVAERFVAAGFRCILVDLPAHGETELAVTNFGASTFEQQLPERVLKDMQSFHDLADGPAFLWGLSMGGAYAVQAAADSTVWDGVIIVSSFASLPSVLHQISPADYRRYMPLLIGLLDARRWLLGQPLVSDMQPHLVAGRIAAPVLLVHGDQDNYVPMEEGRRLFHQVSSQDKQWLTVPGGGHRNVLSTPMHLYARMSRWLLERLPDHQLSSLSQPRAHTAGHRLHHPRHRLEPHQSTVPLAAQESPSG